MRRFATSLLALWALGLLPVPAMAAAPSPLSRAVITEAAGRLDDTLAAVAQSARALGAAYATLSRDTPPPTPEARSRFLQNIAVKDGTVAFRDPAGPCGPDPAAMAACPAFFSYNGEHFTDDTFRELAVMTRLAPAMAAAHDALPFSWVYLTTPGENFAIYPYLPLDKAVDNYQPTQKVFYTAADFANKACGWESPYLDLAGAGMMVTASCPVYDGDKLLAVVSRDVTLTQLSTRVLADLSSIPGARAILMNRRGKAIAASDPKMAAFIASENAKAGGAVVYFRADRGLAALGKEKNLASPDEGLNDAAEMVIEQAATSKKGPMALPRGRDTILAARLRTTGWYLVLVLPQKAEK